VTSGAALKEEGLGLVEDKNSDWVRLLRAKAVEIAIEHGEVHIDDLRRFADAEGLAPEQFCDKCLEGGCDRLHKNAWGAVFRGKNWIFTGRYRKSEYTTNHTRECKVWMYADHSRAPKLVPAPEPVQPQLHSTWGRGFGR
jgi:hypothetical protein